MPNPPVFEAKNLYDYLRSLEQGQHNGIDALLVPRNQASFLRNATVRGNFVRNRPGYRKIALNFAQGSIQEAMEQALWQGAAYYKSDYGPEYLMAAIGGRLFRFIIGSSGANVDDQTIPGDPNPSSVPQAWLWQSEKWLIWNDGQSLPVFWTEALVRRSQGAGGQTVGTSASTFTPPVIGSTGSITLSTAYTGVVNAIIQFGGFLYQVLSTTAASYSVILTNQNDTPGATVATGTSVIVPATAGKTNKIGTVVGNHSLPGSTVAPGSYISVPLQQPVPANINNGGSGRAHTEFRPNLSSTAAAGQTTVQVSNAFAGQGDYTIGAGQSLFFDFGQSIPPTNAYPVGTVATSFTVPAVGADVSTKLNVPYTGPAGQAITINGKNYTIRAGVDPAPGTSLTVINLNAPGNPPADVPSGSLLTTVAELPAGRMGAYGKGRNWMSLTDRKSYIASDIVNGASGTPAFNKRDSVLRITENTYLAGGGTFQIPTAGEEIRAMIFSAELDTSLGQGPLQVLTPNTAFSCQAPVDRSQWQGLTNPIQTQSLISTGGLGHWSTVVANSDILFRSLDGIRSLLLARREFATWGNVPSSYEVAPTLRDDEQRLLEFGSAIAFDNRMLMTANPIEHLRGVYHSKLVSLNFDPISSLRGKAPSVYDGIWDGLNVLQLVKGYFGGTERAFAFCVNTDTSKIELWEILKDDEATTDEGGAPIVWEVESGALNFYENDPRKRDYVRLLNGEIRVDHLVADTVFETFYKSDQWPDWEAWHSWTESVPAGDPGYRSFLALGQPPVTPVDETNNKPLRDFTTMQFRLKVTGAGRLLNARFLACRIPISDFARPAGT